MAEVAQRKQWAAAHNLERRALWWGLAWIAVNIGIVVMIVLVASSN